MSESPRLDPKGTTLLPCDGHWQIDGPKEFYRQDHGPLLLDQLASLFEDSALTDVTLKASCGATFPCHRVLLAASSQYFRAMFTSGMFQLQCASQIECLKKRIKLTQRGECLQI